MCRRFWRGLNVLSLSVGFSRWKPSRAAFEGKSTTLKQLFRNRNHEQIAFESIIGLNVEKNLPNDCPGSADGWKYHKNSRSYSGAAAAKVADVDWTKTLTGVAANLLDRLRHHVEFSFFVSRSEDIDLK